jgi:YegS/Rv2252/BmrU family lipid kinase
MEYSGNEHEWLAIFNPVAGGRKATKDRTKILYALDAHKIQYRIVETLQPGDAIRFSKTAVEAGYRKIMGIGGDGTVNEIVNGIYSQHIAKPTDVVLAFMPVGTGNDWVKTIGIPTDYIGAAKTIKTGNYFFQDVGIVQYQTDEGRQKRYFVNIAGMGYDAFVTKAANDTKNRGKNQGKLAYLFQLMKCLNKYKHTHVKVTLDNEEIIEGKMFSLNVGICKYNGNGMMQVPFALPDDGKLDITLIGNLSKWQVIKNTSKLYDGSFISVPGISTHVAETVKIESNPPILLETDGESLGTSPFEFSLIHHGLKLISSIKNRQI